MQYNFETIGGLWSPGERVTENAPRRLFLEGDGTAVVGIRSERTSSQLLAYTKNRHGCDQARRTGCQDAMPGYPRWTFTRIKLSIPMKQW